MKAGMVTSKSATSLEPFVNSLTSYKTSDITNIPTITPMYIQINIINKEKVKNFFNIILELGKNKIFKLSDSIDLE